MWYLIIGAALTVFAAGLLYVSFRSAGLPFVMKMTGRRRAAARLICVVFYALLTLILTLTLNFVNALICMIHLFAFWLLFDLVSLIVSKMRKKARGHLYAAAAVIFCVGWLAYGWIAAHNVRQTAYSFDSPKLSGETLIVQITDAHIGATFDAAGFTEYIEEIDRLSPDAVVVTGDFVDDDTPREDMLGGCDALGKLNAKYGVFYVWGNHDKGYFGAEKRGWTGGELRARLLENGVTVLEDEAKLIANEFYIVGRRDRSDKSRKSAKELLADLDHSKFILMLDHQPHDFDAEAQAGADLVLCGHTHGGQFLPVTCVGEWIGENCLTYGHEKRLDTDFIVSSGIGSWSFKFKTGCFSEYVTVDLKGANSEKE